MLSRRHPIIPVAIAFAIVPGMIEFLTGVRAGLRMAFGLNGGLAWFAPQDPWASESPLDWALQTRWPILMLIVALAMLTPRARWAMPAAWAYVTIAVATVVARFVLYGVNLIPTLYDLYGRADHAFARVAYCLGFCLTQAMDVLPAILLLMAVRAVRRSAMPAVAPVPDGVGVAAANVIASPVLSYQQGREESNLTRWALRLAFAVACLATLRLICELASPAMAIVVPTVDRTATPIPLYLFSEYPAMRLDAMSEYALRVGWALLLVGLWPTRRLIWSRWCVVVGCVAIGLWAILESAAVAIMPDGNFTVAGHASPNIVACIRIVLAELSIPAMILVLLWRPLPAAGSSLA